MLKKSKLFDDNMKWELYKSYTFLSEKSQNKIVQMLEYERKMILNFIKDFKDKEDTNFVKMKEYIERKRLQEIRKQEASDKENISNLLFELEVV